jgi:hypothetical protein
MSTVCLITTVCKAYNLPHFASTQWEDEMGTWPVSEYAKCYLLYSLFNDAFLVSQTIQRQMKRWQMNNELEMMWKKAVVA